MEQLRLYLIGPEDRAFFQYIPGNFRGLLGRDDTVCVGAVCGSAACGAAIAQREQGGGLCYLRYIFVDPKARLCGLGTYLLRGLLGQLRSRGAQEVQAIFSPSMLESGGQTLGILERAGFSRPKPVSTGFSTRLGDIPDVKYGPSPEMAVYSALDAPQAVRDAYLSLLDAGELPELEGLAVHEDYRGRGLGRALLYALLGCLAGQGYSRCRLLVATDNAPAFALCRSAGFKAAGLQGQWFSMQV